jgi:hypothetical protein
MRKLNQNISWQEIHDYVAKRERVFFIAKREEIEFQNIEIDMHQDFENPFPLDTLSIPSIQEVLSLDAIGVLHISPITRIRMLVKLVGGEIWYERIDKGDEWKVAILF